jgi:hypothetical protein
MSSHTGLLVLLSKCHSTSSSQFIIAWLMVGCRLGLNMEQEQEYQVWVIPTKDDPVLNDMKTSRSGWLPRMPHPEHLMSWGNHTKKWKYKVRFFLLVSQLPTLNLLIPCMITGCG